MSKAKAKPSKDNAQPPVNVSINPSVKPTYADELIQVSLGTHCAKLVLGQRYENEVVHTDTIVLPINTFMNLKKFFQNLPEEKNDTTN